MGDGLLLDERTAAISDDGLYRYVLTRRWDEGETVTWIMLNPSTADASQDDPTIRKVVGFSQRWGFAGAMVVNLFAYRATDPKLLPKVDDPVGPDNDVYLFAAMLGATRVVAAWGGTGDYATRYFRRQKVREIAAKTDTPLVCLGITKSGDPRHPLYVPYAAEPTVWASRSTPT